MKISKARLIEIIKEELYRPRPIHCYTQRQLQKEGLMDFINKVFDFFIAEYQKEHSAARSQVVSTIKEKEASTLSDLAKQLNRPISGPKDLAPDDPEKPEDKAVSLYFAMMDADTAAVEALGALEEASATEVWVPEEGKEEEYAKTSDAKTSAKVVAAVGYLEGGSERMGQWVPAFASVGDSLADANSPADAVKAILGWVKAVAGSGVDSQAESTNAEIDEKTQAKLRIDIPSQAAEMKASLNELNAKAQEIGSAIEAGAKQAAPDDAKNESIALRQLLSGIMFEQKKKKKPSPGGSGGGGDYDDYGADDYGYDAEEEYWINYAMDLENQENAELIDAYLSGDEDPDDEDEFEEYEHGYDDYDDYDDEDYDDYDDGGDY